MSLSTTSLGAYLDIVQISEYGIPSWAWYIIGYIFLVSFSTIVIFSIWKENSQNKKLLEDVKLNDIRLEKAKYREQQIEKIQITNKLVELDRYLSNEMAQQSISAKVFLSVIKRWFVWFEFPYLVFITITWSTGVTRRIFKKVHYNFVIGRAMKVNNILRDYNLGTQVIIERDDYNVLYEEIRDLEVGLPIKITVKVNNFISLSANLQSIKLLNLKKSVWRKFYYPKIMEPLIFAMKNGFRSCTVIIDNAMTNLQAEVASDMEEYFLGRDL